jgi:hypothetical protein
MEFFMVIGIVAGPLFLFGLIAVYKIHKIEQRERQEMNRPVADR